MADIKKTDPNSRYWQKAIIIFCIALALRLSAWAIFGTQFNAMSSDSCEYYSNSIDLTVNPFFTQIWHYSNWYERTPLYVLFLHLIQRQLIFQVILSAIDVVIMYSLNPVAGWIWCCYPQDIIYSFQYGKETLLLFCVIVAIYLLRHHKWRLIVVIPVIMLGFGSYGGVVDMNRLLSHGFMKNVYEMWKPAFNVSIAYSKWFVFVQAVPYCILLWTFIRSVEYTDVELWLCLGFTLIYGLVLGEPRYREPVIVLIVLYVARKYFFKSP